MKKLLILSLSFIGAFWLVPTIYTLTLSETVTLVSWYQYLAQIIRIIVALVQYPDAIYTNTVMYFVFSILALIAIILSFVFFKKEKTRNCFYGASLLLTIVTLITRSVGIGWSYMSIGGVIENIIPHLLYITSVVLFVIYLLHKYPIHRRPSKVQQLEQQVAELQKQVDELKSKE